METKLEHKGILVSHLATNYKLILMLLHNCWICKQAVDAAVHCMILGLYQCCVSSLFASCFVVLTAAQFEAHVDFFVFVLQS